MGTSAQAIIAKLMTEEVRPVTTLRRSVPAHVDAAVRHGLEKLAADRFATAGDFSLALTGARPFVDASPAATAKASARLDRRAKAIIAGLALAAAAGVSAAAWLATRPESHPVVVRFPVLLPDSVQLFGGGGTKLAISRDGSAISWSAADGSRASIRRLDDPLRSSCWNRAGTGTFNVYPNSRSTDSGRVRDRGPHSQEGSGTRLRASVPRRLRRWVV
jgi:serine/threonine-protein kinase